jgi:molecular chaperone DnaK
LEELKKAKDAGQLDSIRKATDGLNTATHKLAEALYAQARTEGAQQPPSDQTPPSSGDGSSAGPEGKGDGEVIDAEFEDVK